MNVALLIVAILTLVAAALAAWFAYPGYRERLQRPALVLELRGPAEQTGMDPDGTYTVSVRVAILNQGAASALDWRFQFDTRTEPPLIRLAGFNEPVTTQPLTIGSKRVVAVTGHDASDTIPPQHRRTFSLEAELGRDQSAEAAYILTARRMKLRNGAVLVTFNDGGPDARVT